MPAAGRVMEGERVYPVRELTGDSKLRKRRRKDGESPREREREWKRESERRGKLER